MKITLSRHHTIRWLKVTLVVILVLMPLHGLLTTWAGSNTGGLLIWRAWKELLLIPAILVAAGLVWRDKELQKHLFKQRLIWLIGLFIAWQLLVSALFSRDLDALGLGLAIQLRLFLVFLMAVVVAYYAPVSKKLLSLLVLVPAGVVIMFGLLQMFVLPVDFLKHFGYVKNVTIPPFFTIDEQISKIRIASTLRGPNPLGAYLVLPALLVIYHLPFTIYHKKKRRRYLLPATCYLLATLVVLYGSHSRSAWLGFGLAVGAHVLLSLPAGRAGGSKEWRLGLVIAGVGVALAAAFGVYQYRHTNLVEDVVLHDNPDEGGAISSNAGHLSSLKSGVNDVSERPLLGCGPGCAGPASVHNKAGVKLAENYYLQTAQESGVIGLLLLLAILITVAWKLYQRSDDPFNRALLSAFIGLLAVNLLAHAWADDTLAYVFWIALGLSLYNGTNLLRQGYGGQEGKQYGKTKPKKITPNPNN